MLRLRKKRTPANLLAALAEHGVIHSLFNQINGLNDSYCSSKKPWQNCCKTEKLVTAAFICGTEIVLSLLIEGLHCCLPFVLDVAKLLFGIATLSVIMNHGHCL